MIWPPAFKCNVQVIDRSRDPCYYGDVQIMIFNVPLKTNNDQTEVSKHGI